MDSSHHLRQRILRHLLVGGVVLNAGCITEDPDLDLPRLPLFHACDEVVCALISSTGICPSVDEAREQHDSIIQPGCCPDESAAGFTGPYARSAAPYNRCCYIRAALCEPPSPAAPTGAEDIYAL